MKECTESIENMPDVIWAKPFNPGWGGRWYDHPVPEAEQYVKANDQGEIYAWWFAYSGESVKYGYFRHERREAINATIGYRKA